MKLAGNPSWAIGAVLPRAKGGDLCRRRAIQRACLAVAGLVLLIFVGSRGLRDFDRALAHYVLGSLLALFALVYRGSVWLDRPPTRALFRRALKNLLWASWEGEPSALHPAAQALGKTIKPIPSIYMAQNFIRKRGFARWGAHLCLSWGSALAFAITFPLVFGWLHFETDAADADVYRVRFWGLTVGGFSIHSVLAWLAFNALNFSAVMVLAGVALAVWRRLNDPGERATQTFSEDWLPLLILFAVAASGLALSVDARWFGGRTYRVWATTHSASVIVFLLHIPFGKLFHIFQRSAAWAAAVNKNAARSAPIARCQSCGSEFASAAQIEDLKFLQTAMGYEFTLEATGEPADRRHKFHYQQICPPCRRRWIALSQSHSFGRGEPPARPKEG